MRTLEIGLNKKIKNKKQRRKNYLWNTKTSMRRGAQEQRALRWAQLARLAQA
jgi:hypothetical protein